MNHVVRRSPLALAILALLYEEPMHPYRMQQLIKEREKDDVINVRQRASLYQTIDRLVRDGLIAVQQTAKSENRPERTVYRLTELGRETAFIWLRDMLAAPAREYPEFPAAISFMAMLKPDEATAQLERRATALEAEIAEIRTRQRLAEEIQLPRVVVLESDYMVAMRETELNWVRTIIDDVCSGRLDWSESELRQFAAEFTPPSALLERRAR
jgi:DNA-binding PadR family transcriptional regulator